MTNTPSPEIDPEIEAMARGLHEAFKPYGDYSYPWEHPMASREMFYALATAARDASSKWMKENGLVVVRGTTKVSSASTP